MNNQKVGHTPGPWAVEGPSSPKVESAVINGASGMVAYCHGRCYQEATANARLIAAAPDLLEACERVREQLAEQGFVSVLEGQRRLDAAIRKARGE